MLGYGPALYCLWALLAIGLALALAGVNAESITRLLVLALLGGQLVGRAWLLRAFPGLAPRTRFILLGTLLAAVVEGCHMFSMPVFPTLRIGWDTPLLQGLTWYGLDLLVTVPAYVVIFTVIWRCITRYHYTLWRYVLIMGLAQALGDGGLFFWFNAPAMLVFLPYPMSNYHAINVLPFLAVRAQLPPTHASRLGPYLALPVVIGTYLVCGALIKLVGRWWGLAP